MYKIQSKLDNFKEVKVSDQKFIKGAQCGTTTHVRTTTMGGGGTDGNYGQTTMNDGSYGDHYPDC